MELNGRTVIVTGSSSGIGRALALEFARHGANVVCCARRAEKLDETVRMIQKEGGTALAVPTDITRRDQVRSMVAETLERFGQIDILFNNAGSFASIAAVWEVDPELWWHDVTVNLLGSLLCIREVLPHMMERGEGIIFNMDGGRPTGGTGYACGKAGLMELGRVLIKELESVGSRVIVFGAAPGLVRTEMTELQAETEAGRRWIPSTKESFDSGNLRRPEELAEAAVKLVEMARPELTGTYCSAGMDFEKLQQSPV
jgi:NAD(P)-dependent dehydrogenase (short-subunit alcohol dehydrogenase family)